MLRAVVPAVIIACIVVGVGPVKGQPPAAKKKKAAGALLGSDLSMAYPPSHRASYHKEWTYKFPEHRSKRWFLALRYPPELAWSTEVVGSADLLTSEGWKPFKEVVEGSAEHRRMLVIDIPHDDPKLRDGFKIRTTITATIHHQHLRRGKPDAPPAVINPGQWKAYTAATDTFDFDKPEVERWMDEQKMRIGKDETPAAFAHRVYKQLRTHLPYSVADGGPWICSQILKKGFGECCRHAILGTSILRANGIPARTVCGMWAVDDKSRDTHCWGEFFVRGVGWIPYDTTLQGELPKLEAHFGDKKAEVLAGMVDFDWVIDAGPFGRQTVFGIDYAPAFWSEGDGSLDNPKVEMVAGVKVLKRFR